MSAPPRTPPHLGHHLRFEPRLALGMVAALLGAAGCTPQKPAEQRFFDTHIQPILTASCTMSTSPCHRIEPDTGVAAGNLDLSSFEAVQKRRDVLRSYGVYPQPLLLLKAMPKEAVLIPYRGQLLPSDINHLGGQMLQPGSDAFSELKRWLDAGATRDGLPGPPRQGNTAGSCAAEEPVGTPAVDRSSAAYQRFVTEVQPMLMASCAFGNCHGSPQADFFLNCGLTDGQRDANFLRAAGFVATGSNVRVEESELLLRPLPTSAGGLDHTGGAFFANREDPRWKGLREFGELVRQAPPASAAPSVGEAFFNERVMPVLIRKGCALETCHSPNGFNDFRLRPGTVGFLSPFALHRNYQTTLHEFMALDSADVRQSRLVKKNLPVSAGGIDHRGGSLFDGPGGTDCPATFDPATATPFCTMAEWLRLERTAHAADVSPLDSGSALPVAFVARPPDPDGPVQFDSFRGGADLRIGSARLGAGGRIEEITGVATALGPCAGLAGRTDLDIRGPEWSVDGSKLVFAARVGEAGGLDLWLLEPAANRCRELTSDHGRLQGAVKVHNLDPVFAPDGSLVFASTRRGVLTGKRLLPNADLYRVGPALDFGQVETMTVLGGSELSPAFMQNGQLTFTTEKQSADFYQLSGRRINWDLTDYHPLLGQRARSADTFGKEGISIGYQQATEIREGLDRNFLVVLSDASARGGGGALGTFNRSIGPFEEGRSDVTFMRALRLPDPAATGRAGTRGVYRSPSSLPDGSILASFAANVTDPAAEVPRYDLVAVDERTGQRRTLLAGQASSLVEATVALKRSGRLLFRNTPQLVFGGTGLGGSDQATVHFPDLPMLATLLDANLRRGRNVEALSAARFLAVYEAAAPTTASPDPAALLGPERVFTQRQLLGVAPLEGDGSLKVLLPARRALVLELQDGNRQPLFTMREEHQVGPGEVISPGVPRKLFDGVCGGCHGSVSGREPDVAVTSDALTGATISLSRDLPPKQLR